MMVHGWRSTQLCGCDNAADAPLEGLLQDGRATMVVVASLGSGILARQWCWGTFGESLDDDDACGHRFPY